MSDRAWQIWMFIAGVVLSLAWRLEERPNHPDVGGNTTYFIWSVTDKGLAVRSDDIQYSRALWTSMREEGNQ